MKRKFTILTAAFALLVGLAIPLGMWGQTRAEVVAYTLQPASGSNNSYAGNCDITIDDITWNLTGNSQQIPWRIGGKNISSVNRSLYSKTAIADNISKIEVTHGAASSITVNSWTVVVATDANFNNVVSTLTPTFAANSTTTINRPDGKDWSNCYFKFTYNVTVSGNSNKFIEFTQANFYKQESGDTPATYTVTYDCNGGTSGCPENMTNITAGTEIQLADAPSLDGFEFDGWSDGDNIYDEGEDYTVNGNVTFTAQWTEQGSGDVQWVLTDLADLTENDVFVIVGNGYAMTNNNGTSSAPAASAVTIEDDMITSTVATTIQWTVSGNATDGYTFYPKGSTTTWLYCSTSANSGSNNNMRVGTGDRKSFVLETKSGNDYLVTNDDKTKRYVCVYNNSDWRGYVATSIVSTNTAFYKKVIVPSTETHTLTVNGYTGRFGYVLIATPVTVDPSTVDGMILTGDDAEKYDLYYFDQDGGNDGNQWINYKDPTDGGFSLEPGKGYLYAKKATQENQTYTFTLTGEPYDGTNVLNLAYNGEAAFGLAGANLVGNPFDYTVYPNRDFYVMNGGGSEIIPAEDADVDGVEPMQGFFVIAEGEGEAVTLGANAPQPAGGKFVFNITQGRGNVIDRAIVRFGENRMLPKFQLFDNSTKLYIPQGENEYAVVSAAEQGTLPLNFRAAENGTYTLSFSNDADEYTSLILIDNMSRAEIDLLTDPNYTFNAQTTDNEDRFTLVYSKAGGQNLPYSYGFEDNNLATDGWTAQITSYSSGINSAAAHTGSYGFRFQYSENPGYLVSPLLTGGGTNGIELSFYYKEYSSSYGDENFQVGYTTDANETDPSNFTYGEIIEASTSWQQHTETLPAGTVRMAIKYLYVDAFYLYLDDFTFEVSNPCSKPTDLAVTTDGQTATVTWDGTAANNFIVTVNNGTPATGQTSPYTFNVNLSTNYEVTVMADCGAGSTSNPESISFSTPDCLGGHVIGYALSDSYGDGWNGNAINVVDECGNLIETLTIASGSSNNGTLSLCGEYYQFTWTVGGYANETSFTLTDNGVVLYSDQAGSSLTDGQVLYTIGTNTRIPRPTAFTAGDPRYDNVDLSWTENGTATAWEICINGDESNLVPANTNVNFNLTGLQPDNSYSVKVRAVSGSNISCWSDEVTVTTPVACARPENLTESNLTFTTVDLSWTGTANSYVAEYGIWAQAGTDQIATATLDPYTFDLSGFSGKGTVAIRHYNVTDMFYLNVDDIVVKDANGNVVYSEDFESGSIPANISNIDLDGDGYMWEMGTNGISGQSNITVNGHYGLYSASWYNGYALNPDNWLVISDITLGGSITFKAVGQDPSVPYENFAVYVIADNQFTEAYNGTRTSCQVTGLTEGTAYAWRVQGDCGDYASNWVFSMFKTPDNLLIFATNGNWNNLSNWTDTEGNTATALPTADNKVRIDADAIIPAGVVATAKNAVLNGGSIEIEEGGQLKQGGTVKVTMHKGIEGYGAGNEEDADHYYFIATPHSCSYLEESDLFPYVLNVTDGNYDLYAFDPTQELEWINFKSNSDHSEFHTGNNTGLFNKKGYLYANEDDTDLQYVGTVSSSLNNILTESYTYNGTSTDDWNGWKLVGNPFTCDAYISYVDDNGDVLEANFYTLNNSNTYTESESSVALAPLTGALVNFSATGKIQFSSEAPAKVKRTGVLNMNLSQGRGNVDQARLRFGEGFGLEKKSFANSSRIYMPVDGIDYAVAYTEEQGEMPVNFKAEENGTYTLSFTNEEVTFGYLHLIDNMTGNDVDLLSTPSYTFEARTTDYTSRFKLVFATGNANDNFAFYSNGSFVINNEGDATLQVIDINGRILSSEAINGCASVNVNAAQGIYMLRLINGENVKVQKVVVR